ncbi:universal stress protein [Paraburkholderia phymatum]|uniref:UspA domain protein n=1 Tax=Paraburkholderia phymatum (strain DSM 17167 / CIP 108236 / LMG 21445 / STM815) TaxID=391038 RepID=B2JH86_PARP8|nr:universal stress protein [Paraburkholderia phymatum]ACC70324.1 UspA domain protein [Paraburkholderia phymatum STM815]
MSYKTLLVHIDDSRHSPARIALSLDLAKRWDAHLIGLYTVCTDLLPGALRKSESRPFAELEARHSELRQKAHDSFLAAAERAGHGSVEWRAPRGPAQEVATLHARHADLLILGQDDSKDAASYVAPNFVGNLILDAGRPALVVPHAGTVQALGENVLIAWDGSREAARAVADALPLLENARYVTVDIVQHADGAREAPVGIDVAAWLDTHGVNASFSATPRHIGANAGATLLNRASDMHIDLLVMGAYGHSRARERVFGGVTRTMLESMTLPVLMSH